MPELSELYFLSQRIDINEMSADDVSNVTGRMKVLNVLKEQVDVLEKEIISILRKYDKERKT